MDLSALKEAGLTEGEVKVYLALLELGSATTGPIVERSGVARSIIYQLLDKLIQKGLVSYITKAKTKYYEAGQPEKLLEYMDVRERELQASKKKVEQLLPELLLKQELTSHNEANIYLGMQGMITAHEHTYQKLTSGEEYVYLGIPGWQPEPHHLYWQRDHERRAQAGITCRLLFNKDTEDDILDNRNSYEGCESRRMKSDIKTYAGFLIYKDTTVIIIQHPQIMAVEIVNQQIADSFKAYFEEFWKDTKPF